MAAQKLIEVVFPLAGVVRRHGATTDVALSEKPYSPWAVNMRPEDPFEHRMRGGSRPGIAPYIYGLEPDWPTGELYTEGGDILLDEDGRPLLDEDGNPILDEQTSEPITDEAGEVIVVPITGAPALYPEIVKAMEAYGYGELTDSLSQSEGAAPTGCTIGCRYRDRLVVAGEGIIYMSRQGAYGDWEYGKDVEDAGRAFLYQLSEAGEVGETVTALVPHKDAFLVAATEYGLWVMQGDPVDGGSLHNVSRDVGIISQHAWTKVGDTLVFLSRDGLCSVGFDGSGLKNLSRDRLPIELIDIDLNAYTPMLGYQHSDRGVYIFLEGDIYHWYFDMENGGFWPFRLPISVSATFIVDGELLVLDSDDDLWTLDAEDDNGTDIDSHVLFGPFRAADAFFSILSTLHGAVEVEEGGSVTWRIVTGNYAESVCRRAQDAVDNYMDGETTTADTVVDASGTWSNGRSWIAHPRVRGAWIVVWLSSSDVWAFDQMLLEMQAFGGWR